MLDLKKAHPGHHPTSDLGEISTVLMAQEIGACRVIMDDAFGKRLARFRSIEVCSSAKLAAEMAKAGAIDEDLGFTVFDPLRRLVLAEARLQNALSRAT